MIYLDHNATTSISPEVEKAMASCRDHYGNSASSHQFGYQAHQALEKARASLIKNLGGRGKESLVFTSGTTEANNLVIKGLFFSHQRLQKPFHMITQVTEHECVLQSCAFIESLGARVTYLPVDGEGRVCAKDLQNALEPETVLVSLMHANNEIGTLQNIKELAKVTHKQSGVWFHTDAAQTVGQIDVNVTDLDVDFLSFSSHKMYGPKGVGGLYLSPAIPRGTLTPLLHGGGHEFGLRSGTVAVSLAVGLAKALESALFDLETQSHRLQKMRDQVIERFSQIKESKLNGSRTQRLPGNINFTFAHASSAAVLKKLPELALSSGSACAAGGTEPSYVIQALGRSPEEAACSLRLGLGRSNTEKEVKQAIQAIEKAVAQVREQSLAWEMSQA